MGLNPSCNRSPDQRPGFPVLGDPPFRAEAKDIAVAELRAVGVNFIMLTEREVEVFKKDTEANKLGRMGCYIPEVAARSETEKINVYKVEGELGTFKFRRAWYYWMVSGPVPLAVASEMYADPAGVKDVRVAGHCGAPPPDQWVKYLAPDGKPAVLKAEMDKYRGTSVEEELRDKLTEVESYEGCTSIIETYHIDTPDGLRLYVDLLRKHGLV